MLLQLPALCTIVVKFRFDVEIQIDINLFECLATLARNA